MGIFSKLFGAKDKTSAVFLTEKKMISAISAG